MKAMYKTSWCIMIFVLLSFVTQVHSQDIISIEFRSTVSKATFQAFVGTFGADFPIKNGSDIYRVTYSTTGSDMKLDTASGLLILPDVIDGPLPILNYQHGTTAGRSDVPSNLSGQEYLLASIFTSLGFATFAPDYIGMGESRGFHPYVHAETEASAMIDMLSAIKQYMDANDIIYNDQLFITGYSQGGHAAMAAHRVLERDYKDQIAVTASLPMSGPYSISGVMLDLAFMEEEFFFPSYLVYSTLGIKAIYPELYDDISEIFREDFVDMIRPFSESGEGLFTLNVQLLNELESKFGGSFPKFIFKDSLLNVISTQPDHLFNQALRESDLFDWTPEAPVLMLYCESDDQVPFKNSIIADSVMNANGAANVEARDVSGGANLSHGECIVPALSVGIPWILSYLDSSTPTEDILYSDNFRIYPNPTSDRLFIESKEQNITQVSLFSLNGGLMYQAEDNSLDYQINMHNLINGMYLLKVETDEGVLFQKIAVQN